MYTHHSQYTPVLPWCGGSVKGVVCQWWSEGEVQSGYHQAYYKYNHTSTLMVCLSTMWWVLSLRQGIKPLYLLTELVDFIPVIKTFVYAVSSRFINIDTSSPLRLELGLVYTNMLLWL